MSSESDTSSTLESARKAAALMDKVPSPSKNGIKAKAGAKGLGKPSGASPRKSAPKPLASEKSPQKGKEASREVAVVAGAEIVSLAILTEEQLKRRAELEAIVDKGLETFREVGEALVAICVEGLWMDTHVSFADYVEKKWGFGERKARYMMSAASITRELEDAGEKVVPKAESQVRPLVGVPTSKRSSVWREAVEAAKAEGLDTPTARHVRKAVGGTDVDPRLKAAAASGVLPEGTTIETTFSDLDTPEAIDTTLSDDAYLETFKIRDDLKVNTRRLFDASALAYRAMSKARKALAAELSPILETTKKAIKDVGPYLSRWTWALRTGDPSTWKLCTSCKGQGVSPAKLGGGSCADCRGNGFHV